MRGRQWWIRKLFQGEDPLKGIHGEPLPGYAYMWGGDLAVFAALIEEEKPELVVEVGTWLGASAVTMGSRMIRLGIDGVVVCVDTFLGDPEWREWKEERAAPWKMDAFKSLNLVNGFPNMYETFLKGIIASGLEKRIVPFPATSIQAYFFMKREGIVPDLIYIDGDHSERQVYEDVETYYSLLGGGGLIFGDDFNDPRWEGVTIAVTRFARENGLKVELSVDEVRNKKRFWKIRKPL